MPPLIDIIQANIEEICQNHVSSIRGSGHTTFRGGITLNIDTAGCFSIYKTTEKILVEREVIGQNYSQEFIDNRLFDIVFSCHNQPSNTLNTKLRQEINSLLTDLQTAPKVWVFFIPIVNLDFVGLKKLPIGSVNFYKIKVTTIKYFGKLYKIESFQYGKKFVADMASHRIGVIAIAKVEAGEFIKAKSKAILKVESALNILRFYNFVNRFATQREFNETRGCENIFWSQPETNQSGESGAALNVDNLSIFPFDRSQLDFLRKNGFTNFSKIMAKPDPSELEAKILSSLHWYGLAIKDEQNVDKFVKLVIALESLLLDNKDPAKKILLADRAAFLLGKVSKERQEIYNSVYKAYSLRGDIVHEGRYDLPIKEIIELREILWCLIIKLARMTSKVSTLAEIKDKIKETKFNSKAIK